MKTQDINLIPDDVKAALQEALDNAARGIRDPEKAKQALERLRVALEEKRRLYGEQNIAVDLIRQTRDQA
jgi:hypothetical protein